MNLIADRKAFNPKIIFTISFVCGLLFLVVLRNNGWQLTLPSWATPNWFAPSSSASASPEDAVYGMLDAARAGNTTAYLAAFSGSMRDQILQVVKENSEPNFSSYLKSQNAAFQGVAVSVIDRPSDTEAQVRVEYVYSNRNEIQNVSLRKESSRWKIVKVAGAEQIKTLLPFGSAVTD
jgi:hypothetical protein